MWFSEEDDDSEDSNDSDRSHMYDDGYFVAELRG